MAVNEISVDADAGSVWGVLSDPDTYAVWVPGARSVLGWEGDWPTPGARFRHEQGMGPIVLVRDDTEVLEAETGRRLLLEARLRPWLVVHIELALSALGPETTRVTMTERPVRGWLLPAAPVLDLSIKGRNAEALDRLKALAEQRFRGGLAASLSAR